MDYQGQKDAERIGQTIIIIGFFIGTVYGWLTQNLIFALYGWISGLVLSFLVCVPSWPCFRRHPIKWLPDQLPEADGSSAEEAESEEEMQSKDRKKPLSGARHR